MATGTEPESMQAVSFKAAFGFWLKLGFISFGGPAGQIAVMHHELVERRRWIPEERFLHALSFCMLLPGPEGQQLATYLGWLLHRTKGGIVAGTLFVLPSLVMLIALSWIYAAFGDTRPVIAVFAGIKPAVVALVAHAVVRLSGRVLTNNLHRSVAAAAFVATFALEIPFPAIIGGAALIGYAGGRIRPTEPARPTDGVARAPTEAAANIQPAVAPPRHLTRMAVHVAVGGLLWVLPLAALAVIFGTTHVWTQMAWFFTKAALLTFGGAYAVLPYVYTAAVTTYGWLQPSQMIDGLALGETTPGPLIMVVAFVGFLGSYELAPLGPTERALAGIAGAIVVTWFTFLPSFLFVLIGGPLVESTRGDRAFTAPLGAITAAVVGAMLSLALFFGFHVLWPQGRTGPIDVTALLFTVSAAVALIRYRVNAIAVIAACAAAGLVASLLSRN